MAIIYHITSNEWWQKWANVDYYESPTLYKETFIHLSTAEQVEGVLSRFYAGQANLLKLHIDTEKLRDELKYEIATNNELFPHLFGRLYKDAIINIEELN